MPPAPRLRATHENFLEIFIKRDMVQGFTPRNKDYYGGKTAIGKSTLDQNLNFFLFFFNIFFYMVFVHCETSMKVSQHITHDGTKH